MISPLENTRVESIVISAVALTLATDSEGERDDDELYSSEEVLNRADHAAHTDTDELARRGGWTLHQLRHSALTHEAEDGTNTPTLLARSRHARVER